jgi:PKD repeat protein
MYYGYGLVNAYDALQYTTGDSPPTCIITSPSDGATVSGIIDIDVTATDDVGVEKVDFFVNGGLLGSDYTSPYSISWDTTIETDGPYTITATAFDTADQTTSDSISVTVDNINDPPVADAGPDQSSYVDETVTFDGSDSYDPDGTIESYAWTFGDGGTGSGEVVTHSYTSSGTYTVSLTVTDNEGLTDTDYAIVTIEDAPSEVVEFEDSFEVSEWNGLWFEDSQNDWFRSTHRASHGSYAAEIDGYANNALLTMVDSIDLSGKTTATLTYSWYIERGWDTGEYIALDVHDGSWQQVTILRGNVDPEGRWHHETIDLTSYMNSDFKIRFRAKVSRSNEDGHVDNVKIISYT